MAFEKKQTDTDNLENMALNYVEKNVVRKKKNVIIENKLPMAMVASWITWFFIRLVAGIEN